MSLQSLTWGKWHDYEGHGSVRERAAKPTQVSAKRRGIPLQGSSFEPDYSSDC